MGLLLYSWCNVFYFKCYSHSHPLKIHTIKTKPRFTKNKSYNRIDKNACFYINCYSSFAEARIYSYIQHVVECIRNSIKGASTLPANTLRVLMTPEREMKRRWETQNSKGILIRKRRLISGEWCQHTRSDWDWAVRDLNLVLTGSSLIEKIALFFPKVEGKKLENITKEISNLHFFVKSWGKKKDR